MSNTEVRQRYAPERVLTDWRQVNQALPEMNEAELLAALREESSRLEKRKDVIVRLHRRFTKVRQERELQEYLS